MKTEMAKCCYDNTAYVRDVYKFTIKNLIDLSKYCVKELFSKDYWHVHSCIL